MPASARTAADRAGPGAGPREPTAAVAVCDTWPTGDHAGQPRGLTGLLSGFLTGFPTGFLTGFLSGFLAGDEGGLVTATADGHDTTAMTPPRRRGPPLRVSRRTDEPSKNAGATEKQETAGRR
ncbi:hypothetical protein AB0D49_00265 [Streptomyces sp. NPDC048290]|uniref:hypothetical protein n=1 Tax=Streptomyces sp. NPDC048290 TaxID=3155811 RepID=UPI003431FA9B